MKLVAVIPTLGRKRQIDRLLSHLERQQRKPDEVIISAPDSTHVEPYRSTSFPISYVFGQRGLSAQRNLALSHALPRSDIVTFFDDDFLPADSYLKIVAGCFETHSDWAVIMGRVVADGARHAGFAFEQGLALLRSAEASAPTKLEVTDHIGAYGCNMSMRSRLIGQLRFDERLVLYGWQEDIDFTSQLRRHGRIVLGLGRDDDVVRTERPVDVLDGDASSLGRLLEGFGALDRIFDVADAFLSEVRKHDEYSHDQPPCYASR